MLFRHGLLACGASSSPGPYKKLRYHERTSLSTLSPRNPLTGLARRAGREPSFKPVPVRPAVHISVPFCPIWNHHSGGVCPPLRDGFPRSRILQQRHAPSPAHPHRRDTGCADRPAYSGSSWRVTTGPIALLCRACRGHGLGKFAPAAATGQSAGRACI